MPAPTTSFLALVLRAARHQSGLSQRRLARLSGQPLGTIVSVESGRRDIKVTALAALLTTCGWDLQVVDGAGRPVDALVEDHRRDRAGRRYPAHVTVRSTSEKYSWWGDRWGYYWGIPPRPDWTFDLPRRPYPAPVNDVPRVQRVAAYGVIHDSTGRVLLTRLTDRTTSPGWWTLPGGGVDHGEHPEDAMVREVHEETGLRVRATALLGVDSIRRDLDHGGGRDDFHAIRIVYRATAEDEDAPLVHERDGSTDLARWVQPAELAGMPLVDLVPAALAFARPSAS
jgi:ADP-ribose pyrophosphatase YjhB (NUDIX family)/transcriptional regulator with XRE-family HTH domain